MADEDFAESPLLEVEAEAKPVKKYRCHVCAYVEQGTPIQWCKACSDDYQELKELARLIETRIGFTHRDAAPGIKRQLNLLIGEVNELRLKVKRLER